MESVWGGAATDIVLASRGRDDNVYTTVEARTDFSEITNKIAFGNERFILIRRNKAVAAVVTMDDLSLISITKPIIPQEISTVEARNNFADLVNKVSYGKDRIIFTRRGKPIGAMVSVDEFLNFVAHKEYEDTIDWDQAIEEIKNSPRRPVPETVLKFLKAAI